MQRMVTIIFILLSSLDSQGARRIVHEWTDLDFEARKFTAKILGDEMDNPEALASSEKSTNDGSSEDLESKAEL